MARLALLVIAFFSFASAPVAKAQRVRLAPPESRKPRVQATAAEEAPDSESSQPKDGVSEEGPKPFSPFGDSSRFSRLGGWGGIGGAMGQWGLGISMLMTSPAVQKELDLSERQIQELADWTKETRDRAKEMGEGFRAEGEAVLRNMDLGAAMRLMNQIGGVMQENERGIERILTRRQWARLRQIELQMQGVTALTRPDVAEALVLAPEQFEQIHEILAESRFRQIGYWMRQGVAMRQRAEARKDSTGGEPGPQEQDADGREGSAKPDSPNRDDDEAVKVADTPSDSSREARRRTFRREFEAVRDGADRLHEETVARLLKILTRRQRNQFERMLGPPFDPDALAADRDRPRAEDADRPRDGRRDLDHEAGPLEGR